MVAERLDKKIRDNLRDARNSLFSGDNMPMAQLRCTRICKIIILSNFLLRFLFSFHSFTRPLLVILDRTVDLATPLHHTWTYQALTHDVLVGTIKNGILFDL